MKACLRRVVRFLSLFFCGDPYPQTPATIARAKADQLEDRQRAGVDEDGHVRRLHGLGEIQKATADNLAYFADHRPQGYAFTFKPKDK